MRITLVASDLHDALKQSAYARGATPLDTLRHVSIQTLDRQHIAIAATDLVARTRIVLPAEVEDPGEVVLDAEKLLAITTGGGDLQLSGTGRIARGRSRYHLLPLPATDFPHEDATEFGPAGPAGFEPASIDPVALAAGIAQVQHAADEKDARPFCRAVFLAHGRLSAGNGIVLSSVEMPGDHPVLLIPVNQLRHLDGLLHQDSRILLGNVRAAPADARTPAGTRIAGLLRVESGGVTVTITCIDAMPFDTRRLLDDNTAPRPCVTFDRKALIAAVRRFSPFVIVYGKGDSGIVVQCRDGRVSLADGTGEASSVEDVTDHVVGEIGAEFAAGIAHRYLLGVLGAIDTDEVDLYLDPVKPHRILPHGRDMQQVAHLIAPQALRQ